MGRKLIRTIKGKRNTYKLYDEDGLLLWRLNGKAIKNAELIKIYDKNLNSFIRLVNYANSKEGSTVPVTPYVDSFLKKGAILSDRAYEFVYGNASTTEFPWNKKSKEYVLKTKNSKGKPGTLNLVTVPENLLDTIAISAGRAGTPLLLGYGLVAKEKTLGEASKYDLGNNSKKRYDAYINGNLSLSKYALTNNREFFNNTYNNYISSFGKNIDLSEWFPEAVKNRIALDKDIKYQLQHNGIPKVKHYSNDIMVDAFSRFNKDPYNYNGGLENYVPMELALERELMTDPNFVLYLNTRGLELYNKGKKEALNYKYTEFAKGGNLFSTPWEEYTDTPLNDLWNWYTNSPYITTLPEVTVTTKAKTKDAKATANRTASMTNDELAREGESRRELNRNMSKGQRETAKALWELGNLATIVANPGATVDMAEGLYQVASHPLLTYRAAKEFIRPFFEYVDTGGKLILRRSPNTLTRYVGTGDSGYRDALTSGVVRGNSKPAMLGTAKSLHKTIKRLRSNGALESDLRDLASNNIQSEEQFNRLKEVFDKTFGLENNLITSRIKGPFVGTYQEYIKDLATLLHINDLYYSNWGISPNEPEWASNWNGNNMATFARETEDATKSGYVGDYAVQIQNADKYARDASYYGHLAEHPTTEYPLPYNHPDVTWYKKTNGIFSKKPYMVKIPSNLVERDAELYNQAIHANGGPLTFSNDPNGITYADLASAYKGTYNPKSPPDVSRKNIVDLLKYNEIKFPRLKSLGKAAKVREQLFDVPSSGGMGFTQTGESTVIDNKTGETLYIDSFGDAYYSPDDAGLAEGEYANGGSLKKYSVRNIVDEIYKNSTKEILPEVEPLEHYLNTISEEEADSLGYYPDARGHRDDRVKLPTHPSHPSRGTWHGLSRFDLSDRGMEDPNYTLFGLTDGNQDPLAVLTYKGATVLPEITVTPLGNYYNDTYNDIKIYDNGGSLNSISSRQYSDLSLKERALIIKTAVRNGYRSLPDIVDAYNKFACGGKI